MQKVWSPAVVVACWELASRRGWADLADETVGSFRRIETTARSSGADRKCPPEKVIVTVKQVCGLPMITFAGDTDAAADSTQAKQISDMMVRAAIDEYYERPQSSESPAGSLRATP